MSFNHIEPIQVVLITPGRTCMSMLIIIFMLYNVICS